MEKTKFSETGLNQDYIVFLNERGYEIILEKIILGLTPKAVLDFENVSPEWFQIVHTFNESNSSRIQKLINQKIDLEWRRKDPAVAKRHFRPLTVHKCMAGDKTHIAQVEKLEHDSPFCVTIMDSHTLNLLHNLPLLKPDGSFAVVCDVKLAMDENYLVAFVWTGRSQFHFQIWNRKSNYSPHPLMLPTCSKVGSWINVQRLVASVPSVRDGVLQVPVTDGFRITSEEWCLSKHKKLNSKGKMFCNLYEAHNDIHPYFAKLAQQ